MAAAGVATAALAARVATGAGGGVMEGWGAAEVGGVAVGGGVGSEAASVGPVAVALLEGVR